MEAGGGGVRAQAAVDVELPVYCISARDAQVREQQLPAVSLGFLCPPGLALCRVGWLTAGARASTYACCAFRCLSLPPSPRLPARLPRPQKLEGRCRKDGPTAAFSRLEHTEVPALREHVHDIARRWDLLLLAAWADGRGRARELGAALQIVIRCWAPWSLCVWH